MSELIEKNDAIAIIGIAAQFADADNSNQFFSNLLSGLDSVTECPYERRKDIEKYLDYIGFERDKRHYRKASFLKRIDEFDHEFFHISPREAKLMDPHQRLLLQTLYQAIEDSGYSVDQFNGKDIGIYTGYPTEYSCKTYQHMIMETNSELSQDSFSGNLVSMLPARLSYYLNLHGPAIIVDTSCSSSLTAVHLACQAINSGDCEIAIASGINIFTVPLINDIVNSIGIVSEDGKARPFDESSAGVGQGEGVGAVVLKPLDQALKDFDHIYAVILSSAINQDGKTIGITAPSMVSQETVIVRAWEKANIEPESIRYIEAHGTATKLGDPTEISGINRAFKRFTSKKQICGVGSLKSNIGHTIGAAGVASIIKVAMSLDRNIIPPTIHFEVPNKRIPFQDSAVFVQDRAYRILPDTVTRCGVSSFGISGTNCHIVLDKAPEQQGANIFKQPEKFLLTISAKSHDSLYRIAESYAHYFQNIKNQNLYDICYTANVGRKDFNFRVAFIVSDMDDLIDCLNKFITQNIDCRIFVSDNLNLKESYIKIEEAPILQNLNIISTPEDIAKKYVNGEQIDWEYIYRDAKGRRVSLPPYQFKKNRSWFSVDLDNKQSSFTRRHFVPVWRSLNCDTASCQLAVKGKWLIFSDQSQFSKQIKELLQKEGNCVIEATLGERYEKINNNLYTISSTEEDFEKILNDISRIGISKVIFFSCDLSNQVNIDSDKFNIEPNINKLMNVYYLSRVLSKKHINNLDITYVVNSSYIVNNTELYINSENAALVGFVKAQKWEIPSVSVRCIDVDKQTRPCTVLTEINYQTCDFLIAYRNDQRFICEISELIESSPRLSFVGNGVYLVIGGNGRIGNKICERLSWYEDAKIVIISRTVLPPREQWDKYRQGEGNETLTQILNKYKEYENNGASVYQYSVDVSDVEKMTEVINHIHNYIGPIQGIFYCAVDDTNLPINCLTEKQFVGSLSAKMQGAMVLEQLTRKDPLKFFVLFSSVMTLVSGVGASSYTAANSFLEAFAQNIRLQGRRMLAISWPEWKNVDLDEKYMNDEEKSIFKKIDADNAIDILFELIFSNCGHVIVGEINKSSYVYSLKEQLPFTYSNEIMQTITGLCQIQEIEQKSNNSKNKPDVVLTGRKSEQYSNIEFAIATAFNKVLGYEEISVKDNYFELGGDSIAAAKIGMLLEEDDIKIRSSDVLKYQTIELLAEYVEQQ